ncbi:MAG: ROK family protein [Thermoleophilia bacterium]
MTAIVGIDAGGTKLAAGIVDIATGAVSSQRVIDTNAERGGQAVLDDVVELARSIVGDAAAIGIGVPEMVDATGRIRSAANWDWRELDLAAAFAGLPPVRIVSDVQAAACAESRLGAGREFDSFLYVSVGTGISSSFVLDGRPWSGADGRAILLGAPLVEEQSSGPAIARAAGTPTAQEAFADPTHAPHIRVAADALGRELARAVHLLDPGAIVLGGGLGLNATYRKLVAEALAASIDPTYANLPPVVPAQFGDRAGIVGAAECAAQAPS